MDDGAAEQAGKGEAAENSIATNLEHAKSSSPTDSLLEFKQLEREVQNAIESASTTTTTTDPTPNNEVDEVKKGELPNLSSESPAQLSEQVDMENGELDDSSITDPPPTHTGEKEDTASTTNVAGSHSSPPTSPPVVDEDAETIVETEAEPLGTELVSAPTAKPFIPTTGGDQPTEELNAPVEAILSQQAPEPPSSQVDGPKLAQENPEPSEPEAGRGGETGPEENALASTEPQGEINGATPNNEEKAAASKGDNEAVGDDACKCEEIKKDPKAKTKVCTLL